MAAGILEGKEKEVINDLIERAIKRAKLDAGREFTQEEEELPAFWEDRLSDSGWHLLGAVSSIDIQALDKAFGDKLLTVWAWDDEKDMWKVYSPDETVKKVIENYITLGVFENLTEISKGEGFWVRVK